MKATPTSSAHEADALFGFRVDVRREVTAAIEQHRERVDGDLYRIARAEFERGVLIAALEACGGKLTYAAELMGVTRSTARTIAIRAGIAVENKTGRPRGGNWLNKRKKR